MADSDDDTNEAIQTFMNTAAIFMQSMTKKSLNVAELSQQEQLKSLEALFKATRPQTSRFKAARW